MRLKKMNSEAFDSFCNGLKATTHVIQWGDCSVWKVGGKIFAISPPPEEGSTDRFSFKCSSHSYQILCELPGITPAPYLARAKWVQVITAEAMSDDDLRYYITTAYQIIAGKLTRAQRAELGISDTNQ